MIKYFKKYMSYAILIFFGVLAFNFFNTITVSAATGTQTGQSEAFFQTNSGQDILIAPITVNGEVGYCFNAYASVPTGQEYKLLEEAYIEPTIRGALYYGFGGIDNTLQTKYGIPDNQARYATNVVINQHAHDLGVPNNYDALKYANLKPNAHPNLLKYAQELYTKRIDPIRPINLTFNGNTSVQGNYQVSDTIRLSSTIKYNITVSAGEVIEKTDNSFKVRVPLNYTGTVTATVNPVTKNFKTLVWKTNASGYQQLVQLDKNDPLTSVRTSLNFTAPKGSLELLKIDGENTNKKLQSAVFELLKDNRVIATATSNAEGKVLFNDLLPGDYVVREKTAPTGYRLNTNTLNVTVQPGQTNRQNFSNFKIRGNIEVIKQDGEQHSTKLQGAVFELKQGNTIVATATANAQGVASFTNVEYGSYTIVEKTAPTGYRLNPNTLNVTVSEHQRTYQLAFNNFKIKGNVEVLKVDAEDNNVKLPGVTFALLKNGNEVAMAITDTSGIARFTNVEYGTYEVQEKATLENYVLSTTKYPVNIQQHNQTVNITAQNQKIKGNVEVLKVDAEDNNVKLPGITFALLKNGNEVAMAITDTSGIARFTNVEYGTYEVQEKATLENYVLSTIKYPVNIQQHNQTVNITAQNQKIKGNIEVLKVDAEDNNVKLPGVTFALLKDGHEVAMAITDTSGIARFTNVEYGTYEVQEKATLENYVISLARYRVFVSEHDVTYYRTAENKKIKGSIEVLKVAEHDNTLKLEDAVFELRKGTEVIATATTNAEGLATFENVEYGSYTIVEKTAPTRYFLKSFEKEVVVKEDKQVITFTVENEKEPTIETEAHGENMKAEELVDPTEKTLIYENTLVKDLVVNGQYRMLVKGIDPVTKQVIVTAEHEFIPTTTEYTKRFEWTLNGFELPNGITFSERLERKNEKAEWELKHIHNENGEDKKQTVKFKKHGKATVFKIDSTTKEKIERFVKFGLFRDGKLIEEKSSNKGFVVFERLIEGVEYHVKELEAPTGYIKSNEVLKIVVSNQDKELSFEYENTLLPTIKRRVESNDSSNVGIYSLAVLVSIAGFALLRKKQD